jgi:bifunctional DNase/RNase
MSTGFTEMQVDSIRVHQQSNQHVVILKEKAADRYLPIWIGLYEANAIALKITGIAPPRPITHDLISNILRDMGARITRVEVSSLSDDVFYARILMNVDGRKIDVDARPSDAIALAVRAEAPIMVANEVLEKAGIVPELEGDEGEDQDTKVPTVFRELINSMDLPDLGAPEEEDWPKGGPNIPRG